MLIRLSLFVEDDRHLNLIIIAALTFNTITHRLLLAIKDNPEGLDRFSWSFLDSGVSTGEDSGPIRTR